MEPGVKTDVRVSGDATRTGDSAGWTSLRLDKPSGLAQVAFFYQKGPGALNLSAFRDVAVQVKNDADAEVDVLVNATSNPDAAWLESTSGRFLVHPGETGNLTTLMTRAALPGEHPFVKQLGNLYAFPWGHQGHWRHMDTSAIVRVTLRLKWSLASVGRTLQIGHPGGHGFYSTDSALLQTLELPLVDPFGQLREGDWPDKLKDRAEFHKDGKKDLELISKVTRVDGGRSRFGGMADGPKLKATGFFRVEKLNGKWWFVDPEGNLFWSHGVNCVGGSDATKVAGRESLFSEGDRSQPSMNFYAKNLKLKFGEEHWKERLAELSLARMFDWGLNTVGAWSMSELSDSQRIPYTLIVHAYLQQLGNTRKIADPFSDGFQNSLDKSLQGLAAKHAKSPWLLGVYIENELDWKYGHELVNDIIGSYESAPARVALVKFLQERHGGIAGLNQAWDTQFKSFKELQPAPGPMGKKTCSKDLDDFMDLFADRYFAVSRAAMRKHLPNHLFLGSRFHIFNPHVTAAASRHCDVISVNIYQHSFHEFNMETSQDRPWIISEFHFGTPDHGVWGVGLTWAADARNQADLYQAYVSDALRHPNFVGTHWFAWTSQPVTGRGDGENFGMGMVSLVDRPLEKLVRAVQKVSRELYTYRLNGLESRIGEVREKPAAAGQVSPVTSP
ncbi:MAG: beta-galactosidase [Candidatus Methylacidiphilales bacterium]|nr:beta-galactosidase [Candidatus Methylacidiphilales bacterium]